MIRNLSIRTILIFLILAAVAGYNCNSTKNLSGSSDSTGTDSTSMDSTGSTSTIDTTTQTIPDTSQTIPDTSQQSIPPINEIPDRFKSVTFRIYNSSSTKIAIQIGIDSNNLKPYILPSNQTWISPLFTAGSRPIIKIITSKKSVYYMLDLNFNYILAWNPKKGIWDLKKAEKE